MRDERTALIEPQGEARGSQYHPVARGNQRIALAIASTWDNDNWQCSLLQDSGEVMLGREVPMGTLDDVVSMAFVCPVHISGER